MKQKIKWICFSIIAMCVIACEDVIHPELESALPVYVVDAWVSNLKGPQTIVITQTQAYFDNTLPPGVKGAFVKVTDSNGKVYSFVENLTVPGNYVWTPVGTEVFGTVGYSYSLTVQVDGETFTASSKMGRVPPIDSISYDTDKRVASNDFTTRGQFWATDPIGPGDAYWIRTFKNSILLDKPSEINIAYDAGRSAGSLTDGVTFITPVRRGINSNDKDADGKNLSPIINGDSLNVRIYSITGPAFDHLSQLIVQTNRPGGFQELFARPLANVSTNIMNSNPNGTKAQGFFNVSSVSSNGKRYKK